MEYRAVLYFLDYTFDTTDISERMEQSDAVNPVATDSDFYIGVSSKTELKFILNLINAFIPENFLANKEFLLQRGKIAETKNALDVYKKVRKPLFVEHGEFTFAGNDRKPYLSVYDSNFILQDAPEQPLQPVKSLFIVGETLYCIHETEPYLTAYTLSGATLSMKPQIALTDFYKNKLLGYAKKKRCFSKQANIVTEYISKYIDMKISDVVAETWIYKNFGHYIAQTVEKIGDTKMSVIAHDRMQKFEITAGDFIDSISYPIPLKSFLLKLCQYVDVCFKEKSFLNEDYLVPRGFRTETNTCRQVLQWIAQIAASFAYIDYDGNLNFSWYANMDSEINISNSARIDVSDYTVKPIEKVRVRAFESDLGVSFPDEKKDNIYVIENNPLLYATKEEQILSQVTNIYNAIKNFSYIPFSAKVIVPNELVRSGMIINAVSLKGKKFPAYIMQSTLKGVTALSAEYNCTGNEYRKTQTDIVGQTIQVLNRRTNALVFDLEQTKNTLTTISTSLEKVVDDVTGITNNIETITTDVAELKLTSSDFSVRISSTEESLGQTSEKIANLEFSLDGFFVNLEKGGLSFTENGLIVSGSPGNYIKIHGSRIEFFYGGISCGGFDPYNISSGPAVRVMGKLGHTKLSSVETNGLTLGGRTIGFATIILPNGERAPVLTWYA